MSVTDKKQQNITNWLKGQTVFVTGGTGFLGKILIFKLLQHDVETIYVLIRSKKNKTAHDRLEELKEKSTAFETIRKNKPELLARVKLIDGDSAKINLGISDADRRTLEDTVTIVFHTAASTRFDDSLSDAVLFNLRSTRETFKIAERMKNLQVILHVSTAYANIGQPIIEEKLYPSYFKWKYLVETVEKLPRETISALENHILGDMPNTYVFTKKLTEDFVNEYNDKLPTVIFRPAVVCGSQREPEPGWIDRYTSLTALAGGCGQGVIRVSEGPGDVRLDFITVDVCAYTMIAAAYYRTIQPRKLESIPIYNTDNLKVSRDMIKENLVSVINKAPLMQCVWHPQFCNISNFYVYYVAHLLIHVLPGFFFDLLFKIKGEPTRLVRIYRKIYVVFGSLTPFTFRETTFTVDNFLFLKTLIDSDEEDHKNFGFKTVNTKEDFYYFCKDQVQGYRKLAGEPEVSEANFAYARRLCWIDSIVKLITLAAVVWYFPYHFVGRIMNYFYFLFLYTFDLDENTQSV